MLPDVRRSASQQAGPLDKSAGGAAVRREELAALPAVIDVPTAADVLGVGKTAAYELIRCGEWPTPVFRLGKLIRIPTAPLLTLLGLQPEPIDPRTVNTATTGP